MSLIDLYISDCGSVRRIGDNCHDMLTIEDGKLCYLNLQNGEGCRLGEDGEWYRFVDNVDEYGYNCDPRKTESDSENPNNCETCKWGEWYRQGYDITMMDDECGGCCSWNSKWTPQTEPTISKMEQVEDEPKTQMKTQNSNLTFEKADERCNGYTLYKLTCDLFSEICRYEPKDEPQTVRSNLEPFRVDEPQTERSE